MWPTYRSSLSNSDMKIICFIVATKDNLFLSYTLRNFDKKNANCVHYYLFLLG